MNHECDRQTLLQHMPRLTTLHGKSESTSGYSNHYYSYCEGEQKKPEVGDVLQILDWLEDYCSFVHTDDGACLSHLRVDNALTQHVQTLLALTS